MEVGEEFVESVPVVRVQSWPIGPVGVDVEVPVETSILSSEKHAAADLLGVTDIALSRKLQTDGVVL